MSFKVKRTTPFGKLMKVYCERQGAVVVGSLASSRSPLCKRPGNRVSQHLKQGMNLARCAQGSPWSR